MKTAFIILFSPLIILGFFLRAIWIAVWLGVKLFEETLQKPE